LKDAIDETPCRSNGYRSNAHGDLSGECDRADAEGTGGGRRARPSRRRDGTAAEKRPAPRTTRGSWTRADARVCLEFPTNLEIIKCAEKYRFTREPA